MATCRLIIADCDLDARDRRKGERAATTASAATWPAEHDRYPSLWVHRGAADGSGRGGLRPVRLRVWSGTAAAPQRRAHGEPMRCGPRSAEWEHYVPTTRTDLDPHTLIKVLAKLHRVLVTASTRPVRPFNGSFRTPRTLTNWLALIAATSSPVPITTWTLSWNRAAAIGYLLTGRPRN